MASIFISCEPDPYISKEEVTFILNETEINDGSSITITDNGKEIARLANSAEGRSAVVILDEGEHSFEAISDSKIYKYSFEKTNLTVSRHNSYIVNLTAENRTYEVTFNQNNYDGVTIDSLTLAPEGRGDTVNTTRDGGALKATLVAGRKYKITGFLLAGGAEENYQVEFESKDILSVEEDQEVALLISDSESRAEIVNFTVADKPEGIIITKLVFTSGGSEVVTATIDGDAISAVLKKGRQYRISAYELSVKDLYILTLADGSESFTVNDDAITLQVVKGGTINFSLKDDENILPEDALVSITVNGKTIELSSSNSTVAVHVPVDDSVSEKEYGIEYEVTNAEGYEATGYESIKPELGKTIEVPVEVNDLYGKVSFKLTGEALPSGTSFTLKDQDGIETKIIDTSTEIRLRPDTYTITENIPKDQSEFYEINIERTIEVSEGNTSVISADVIGYGYITFSLNPLTDTNYEDARVRVSITSTSGEIFGPVEITKGNEQSVRLKANTYTLAYSTSDDSYAVVDQDKINTRLSITDYEVPVGEYSPEKIDIITCAPVGLNIPAGYPGPTHQLNISFTDAGDSNKTYKYTYSANAPMYIPLGKYSVDIDSYADTDKAYKLISNYKEIEIAQEEESISIDLSYLNFEKDSYSRACTVTGIIGDAREVIVPSYINTDNNEFYVSSIGDSAFEKNSTIISIEMPENLSSIGSNAFQYAESLKNVKLNEGLMRLGPYAFSSCSSLEEIEIPKSLYSFGHNAFANCDSLKTVKLNEGLSTIGDNAFSECKALTKINLPTTVITIGYEAFSSTGLTSIEIPEGVETINIGAFSNCENLSTVKLNEGLSTIEADAFFKCKALTNINIPTTVSEIGIRAFSGTGLTSIEIPEGVETINLAVFSNCENLSTVKLNEGLSTIGRSAFSECKALTNINIPTTVKSIDYSAFYNCTGINKLVIPGEIKYLGSWVFYGWESNQSIHFSGMEGPGEWSSYWNDGFPRQIIKWGSASL